MRQLGRAIEHPRVFLFVDREGLAGDASLGFDDGRTRIETTEVVRLEVRGFPAALLRVSYRSDQLADNSLAIIRIHTENESFAHAALAEHWQPLYFIGVGDGCGGFGGNTRCENQLADEESSIPLRLRAPMWIGDHFPGSVISGGEDPQDGDEILSLNPHLPFRLRQLAFLSTLWRSRVSDRVRLRGGARLFQVMPDTPTVADFTRRSFLHSPVANEKLK